MTRRTLPLLLLLGACAPSGPDPLPDPVGPPDVLLITVDTFRADRAGCLGHPAGLTPYMDRVLRTGRLARDAFAPAPLTAISHASMLTGLEPPSHGVRENGSFTLSADIPTLATYLGEDGFTCGAFISAFPLEAGFGFAQGFDEYDDDLGGDPGGGYYAERPAAKTVDAALRWVQGLTPDTRWFVWAHFFDPHHPREFPRSLRRLPATDDYGREIRSMDYQIGRLLRELAEIGGGRAPVIAILSDHGEGLGDHEELSHGILLYDEVMRGLFGISAPSGSEEAVRLGSGTIGVVARYSDLVPTLYDVLGLPFTERLEGSSLLDPDDTDRGAYGETYYPSIHYHWSPLLSWRDARWTYIASPNPELFDRHADPGERTNVIDRYPAIAEAMRARLEPMIREPETTGSRVIAPEAREKLAALGYLSTSSEFRYDRTKDPRELIGSVNALFRGITLLSEGNAQAALPHMKRAYRADPDNVTAVFNLANCLRELGNYREARPLYRHTIELEPAAAEAHSHLAILEFDDGNQDSAFALLEQGLAHSPEEFSLLMTSGDLSIDVGRLDVAEAFYLRARVVAPRRPEPPAMMARLELRRGRPARARELWDEAVALDPDHPFIAQGLGHGHAQ